MEAVEGEGRLAAALSVPDDAIANPCFDFTLNRPGREKLRVSHDMLFKSGRCSSVGESEAKQEGEAVAREQ